MTTSSSAVGELLKMSHTGYSAPVNSWAGTRAALDKEVNEERREERKRLTTCDEMDRGRVKHIKTTNENNSNYSNPGYNRLQVSEFAFLVIPFAFLRAIRVSGIPQREKQLEPTQHRQQQ